MTKSKVVVATVTHATLHSFLSHMLQGVVVKVVSIDKIDQSNQRYNSISKQNFVLSEFSCVCVCVCVYVCV